mgnify:CR=1 FL=1|tara:strand:- start:67 stop:480 length:414 start_codon:yes stop_codon:yes gene_type:complete
MNITITQVRNAKSLQADNARMEVEINHPDYGWIPYTVDPADTDTTINNDAILALISTDFVAYVAPTAAEITTALAVTERSKRDGLLVTVVDPIAGNALRWAALTSEQRTAWATYRTALLDVPAQAGFPSSITWPTAP